MVGQSQPTELSLDILEDWTVWMVAAGAKYGACRFDGYGALVA